MRAGDRRGAAVVLIAALGPAAATLASAGGVCATAVPAAPAGWTTTYSDATPRQRDPGVDSSWTYDPGTQYSGSGCAAN